MKPDIMRETASAPRIRRPPFCTYCWLMNGEVSKPHFSLKNRHVSTDRHLECGTLPPLLFLLVRELRHNQRGHECRKRRPACGPGRAECETKAAVKRRTPNGR
ncbi:hypothetical protein FRUB_02897 [Fimbriiglobus ruber]|uniref:Uncharacterized protein n=1 Tax=Fimbriiglobus ruber TaxID=1908690 RepID=A0A225DXN6_9BACT|nr:hypothetical protein FRUB_02897 [Fimbriiglobus ruber]